jgi:exonuclease III/ribonuclease HI
VPTQINHEPTHEPTQQVKDATHGLPCCVPTATLLAAGTTYFFNDPLTSAPSVGCSNPPAASELQQCSSALAVLRNQPLLRHLLQRPRWLLGPPDSNSRLQEVEHALVNRITAPGVHHAQLNGRSSTRAGSTRKGRPNSKPAQRRIPAQQGSTAGAAAAAVATADAAAASTAADQSRRKDHRSREAEAEKNPLGGKKHAASAMQVLAQPSASTAVTAATSTDVASCQQIARLATHRLPPLSVLHLFRWTARLCGAGTRRCGTGVTVEAGLMTLHAISGLPRAVEFVVISLLLAWSISPRALCRRRTTVYCYTPKCAFARAKPSVLRYSERSHLFQNDTVFDMSVKTTHGTCQRSKHGRPGLLRRPQHTTLSTHRRDRQRQLRAVEKMRKAVQHARAAALHTQQQAQRPQAQGSSATKNEMRPPSINTTAAENRCSEGGHSNNTETQIGGGGQTGQDTNHTPLPSGCWVEPAEALVYCEPQVDAHCGAHALHALLNRSIATQPQFFYPELQRSMQDHPDTGQFSHSGWYSIAALNHWLYEHTHEDVTLASVACFDPRIQYSKQLILSRAPAGCNGLLIIYRHHYPGTKDSSVMHYKAWVERHGVWIECESIAYKTHKKVKILTDEDWCLGLTTQQLGETEIFCLVRADAYRNNKTLRPPPDHLRHNTISHRLDQMQAVDGSTLIVHATVQRRVPGADEQGLLSGADFDTEMVDAAAVAVAAPGAVATAATARPGKQSWPLKQKQEPAKQSRQQKLQRTPGMSVSTTIRKKKSRQQRHTQQHTKQKAMTDFFKAAPQPAAPEAPPMQAAATPAAAAQPPAQPAAAAQPPAQPAADEQPPATTEQTENAARLRVATWNVRGINKRYEDLKALLRNANDRPHILILTELKMKEDQKCLKRILRDYHVFTSLRAGLQKAQAGLLIAICREWSALATITVEPAGDLQGYYLQAKIELPHSRPMHVAGVYCPSGVMPLRRCIYQRCHQMLQANPGPQHNVLIAGDFNATLMDSDRHTNAYTHTDRVHRQFVAENNLQPVDATAPRQFTFRKGLENMPCCRIDDILTNQTHLHACTTVRNMADTLSDHDLLQTSIPFPSLGMLPPLPPSPAREETRRLPKYISQRLQAAITHAIAEAHINAFAAFEQRTANLIMQVHQHWEQLSNTPADRPLPLRAFADGTTAEEVVEELGQQLLNLLSQADQTAVDVCPAKPQTASVRNLHYRPRAVKSKRRRVQLLHKTATNKLFRLKHPGQQPGPSETASELEQAVDAAKSELQAKDPDLTDADALKKYISSLQKEKGKIDAEHAKISMQQAAKNERELIQANYKVGSKMALGKHKARSKAEGRALLTPTGEYAVGERLITYTAEWVAAALKAPEPNGKTGKYMPNEAARDYPWDVCAEHAAYKGLMQRTAPAGPREWLHAAIADESAFEFCLKTMARGKAPGPDRVANEILQALPEAGKRSLHNMIMIMWATGLTPSTWKTSNTILLYKHKGTPLDLNCYRRIGLELTVYKLWTRMVAFAMADRAERQNMLSSSQAGFRNKRSTLQHMQLLVMTLEDAFWFKQDIYLMQADMTQAFDKISHDKLLVVLYDLGMPTDAIEVVKNLYTGAKTKVQTVYGATEALEVNRGTLQGDSLSPLLFVLYIEPLLRWLQAGDKGYKAGALAAQGSDVQAANQISNVTFADDINVVTGGKAGLSNMKHQVDKVDKYTAWGRLKANPTKTTVTGALHGSSPDRPYDEDELRARLEGKIRLAGAHVQYSSPRAPFRHLGLLLTMDLNFSFQLKAALSQLKEGVMALKRSHASRSQKERIIRTNLRPTLTYVMAAAPYSLADIKLLDSLLTRATKDAHGMATSMPTAAAHEDKQFGGLGCHSLQVEYATICVQQLTRALNHTGPLGKLARALLGHQRQALDALSTSHLPHTLSQSMCLRQLLLLKQCGLTMRKDWQPEDAMQEMLPLADSLAAITPPSHDWDTQMVQDIHLLSSLGITHIETMLTSDGKKVLNADALRLLAGRRNVKQKHTRAWNRVAHYLITGESYMQAQGVPVPEHRGTRQVDGTLQAQLLRRGHAIRPTNNIIHMLPRMHRRYEAQGQTLRDTLLSTYQDKLARNHTQTAANLRQAVTECPVEIKAQTGYARYQQLQRELMKRPKRAAAKTTKQLMDLYAAYSHSPDKIEEVLGLVQATEHTGRAKKRKSGKTQQLVEVRWAAGIQPGWLIEVAKSQGYTVHGTPTPATYQEAEDAGVQRPCEFCGDTQAEAGEKTHCIICCRAYHAGCREAENSEQSTQHAYTCSECREGGWTPSTLPAELRLFRVEWIGTQELPETVHQSGTPQATARLEHLLRERQQQQQQGQAEKRNKQAEPMDVDPARIILPSADERVYDITIGQAVRRKLEIHTAAINPHADIAPTGRATIVERQIPLLTDKGEARMRNVACINEADGRCQHMLTPEAVERLRRGFQHMQQHEPDTLSRLRAGTFEEELLRLMVRYKDGATCELSTDKRILSKHQRSMPEKMYTALHQLFGCCRERFASPLNAHAETTEYWAPYERDQVFAARFNAYSCKWTGLSTAVPDFDDYAAARAVKWAIQSAAGTDEPTLTLMLLPTHWNDKETAARAPSGAVFLLDAPKELLHYQPLANQPFEQPKALHKRSKLMAIGNSAGFAQWCPLGDVDWLIRFREVMNEAMGIRRMYDMQHRCYREADESYRRQLRARQVHEAIWSDRLTSEFRRKPIDTRRPRIMDATAQTLTVTNVTAPPPLLHDWKQLIYTDGSAVEGAAPGIGAAVHVPDKAVEFGPGETIRVNCALPDEAPNSQCVNTIARAELSAIRAALSVAQENMMMTGGAEDIHIATDSLASIYAIKKIVNRPQDLQEHRHLRLLQDICEAISSFRGGKVHIWKVKAHTGVLGNELADRAAVATAKGEPISDDDCFHTREELLATPSNSRSHMYWPRTIAVSMGEDGQEEQTFRPLPTLGDALKAVVHPVMKLGQANRESLYWQKWQAAKEQIAHEFSHTFMGSSKVPFKTKKLALQYRWGLLPTQRWLYKCKLSDSLNCPLCGEEDGGHHALSGCKAVNAAVTKRHNDAGTEIVEAIARGRQAASLLMSDVGIRRRLTETEIEGVCRTAQNLKFNRHIKDTDLSIIVNEDEREALEAYTGSIPDALMYSYDKDTGTSRYTVVEIKYCRDTDPAGQEARAHTQHQGLVDLLSQEEAYTSTEVEIVPLLLGVSGVIYKSFMTNLDKLGVTGSAKATLARKLHMLAVKHVRQIWKLRRKMSTELQKCSRHNWSKAKRRLRLHQAPLHRKAKRRRKQRTTTRVLNSASS